MRTDDWLWEEGQKRAKQSTRWLLPLVAAFSLAIIAIPMSYYLRGEWGTGLPLSGLISSAAGAIILAVGAIPKEETAYWMSTTRLDGNPDLFASLLANRKVAKVGIAFVLTGFLFQLADMALSEFIRSLQSAGCL